jgi:predicted cytidylate kinase
MSSKTTPIIISFNGQEGSGKSTIAKLVAEKLGWPRFYMGQIFRDKATESGLTLVDFLRSLEKDPTKEKEIDSYMDTLVKKNKSFVIEGRVAWHLIPQSIKIYLKVDAQAAAKRIFKVLNEDHARTNEDSGLNSITSIEKSILQRREKDSLRYFNLYGIRQDDENNYDFVIDTTELSIEEVFGNVMEFIERKNN